MIKTIKREKINIEETIKKIFPKILIKDLKEHERICSVCHGLGMRIENNDYGIEGDTSEIGQREMFPYKHQSLSFCQSCYNGVQKLCPYCGEPYKQQGYYHCDCEGQKKTDEEKRIKKWKETISKAKEIQESDVTTMLYCEEFDTFYTDINDFFEEYEREYFNGRVYTKPDRLWLCSKEEISIEAANVIDSACDKLHEDAYDNCDKEALQKILDDWCETQTGATTYYPCYKEYVRIDWSKYEGE